MFARVARQWALFVAIPTVTLVGCHLVGGTNDLYVDEDFYKQGGGGNPDGGTVAPGGEGGTPTSVGGRGGQGGEPQCNSTNCPPNESACEHQACVDDACTTIYVKRGDACAVDGNFCDGGGFCVECTLDEHCASNVCQSDACYEPGCANGNWDMGTETDVDCGNECGPCDNTKNCDVANDCKSRFCRDGQQCDDCDQHLDCAATQWCDDGDNGGVCKTKKDNGSGCYLDEMCSSGCCAFFLIFPICQSASSCN